MEASRSLWPVASADVVDTCRVGSPLLKDQHDGGLERRCIGFLATLASISGPENSQELAGERDVSSPLALQEARANKPIINFSCTPQLVDRRLPIQPSGIKVERWDSSYWLCGSWCADLVHRIKRVVGSPAIFTRWNVVCLFTFFSF